MMNFKHVRDGEPVFENGYFFWRYLDINKFISLLISKSIYFSRLDTFNDPLEGITFDSLLALAFVNSEPDNPSIPDFDKTEIIRNNQIHREAIKQQQYKSQSTQFVSCWFYDDCESLAMWDLYSTKQGVAIKITCSDLLSHFKEELERIEHEVVGDSVYGFIEYLPLSQYDPYKISEEKRKWYGRYNAFKKDKSYIHEKEFRFIAAKPFDGADKPKGFNLVNIESLLDKFEFIAHPLMDDWQILNLQEIINKFCSGKELKKSYIKVKSLFT